MNENVTNKTPKTRRWVARLLVSALCILLASSLLFVTVVAENVNTYTFELTDQSTSDSHSFYGYFYGSDGYYGLSELAMVPSGFYFYGTSYLYENSYSSPLFQLEYSGTFGTNFAILSVGSSPFGYWVLYSYGSSYYAECFNWSGSRTVFISTEGATYSTSQNSNKYFCYFSIDGYAFSGGINDGTFIYSNGVKTAVEGYYNCLIYGDGSYFALSSYSLDYAFNLTDYSFSSNTQSFGISPSYYLRSFGDIFCAYYPGNFGIGKFNRIFAIDDGVLSYSTASGSFSSVLTYNLCFLGNVSGNGYSDTEIGRGWSNVRTGDALSFYKIGSIYATSSEYVPPESSDETTEEPPPESSEPGEPGTFNIYRTDIDRSGGVMVFNSTLDTSIPSDGLESLSAYLGYYWDVDSSVQPPPSYMYLWASYEDGTRQRYDFDFSSYGYALGSDFSQNFYYPDYLGMEFEIPLNGETDIYFVTSSPGGSVTVENSDGRIITLNFGSVSSYARIDFVDELNYRITLYNNDMAIGNSLTFDQGVYRYLFVYNVDSVVNTWYYPEPGTSTLINYDKVENGLYNVVLTLNDKIPDYGKPGDFEDAVSRYEEIEGAVSSTMSETWEYLESLQEELNGSFDIVEFSEANAKLDQILSTPGGDTIFTFFKSLWGINPFLPTFAVMTVCFAGVAFIIRKI